MTRHVKYFLLIKLPKGIKYINKKSKKILIVDDNPKILFLTKKQITAAISEVIVLTSNSGSESLKLIAQEKPNVILLDILMPGMNGYEVCRKIKHNPETDNIPVVLISSLDYNHENRLKAIEAGADAFITKPLNKQELTLQLSAMIKVNENNIQKKYEQIRLEQLVSERTNELTAELKRRNDVEKELQKNEEKFKKISALSSDYAYSYRINNDGSPELEWHFGAFEEITGYPPFKTLSSSDLSKIVHADDLYKMDERAQKLIRGETVTTEIRIVRKTGEIKWIRDKCEPEWNSEKSKVIRHLGTAHDITDRKNAEEETQRLLQQLTVIIENVPGGLFIVDENCRLIRTNSRFKSDFGELFFKIPEVGDNLLEQLQGNEWQDWVSYCKRVKAGENFVIESRCVCENKVHYYEYHFAPVKIEDKESHYIVVLVFDITERKLNEQKIIDKEKELEELNATKDRFFSVIAHDLKGPFGSVLGLSNLINQRSREGDFKNLAAMSELLVKATTHSFDLLNNLLEWSRTQTGRKQYNPKSQNLHDIIESIIQLFSVSAKQKNIRIEMECAQKLKIFADSNMLKTVIRNLLSNAIKYSYPDSEIKILAAEGQNEVKVSVTDRGMGMTSEQQEKLFKIGEDFSTAGTNKEKGTGLGLILCKEFVEMHGGEIGLESEQGIGSSFYFTLPRE